MKLEKLAEAHHKIPSHSIIKTPDQIAGIKESAKINVAVLDYIGEHCDIYLGALLDNPRGYEHSRD